MLGRKSTAWFKRKAAERPCIQKKDCSYATQGEEPPLVCQKISALTSPLTSRHLILQITILSIIMCVAWISERPTKLCNTKNELKARIIAAFTYLRKENVGKPWRRFQGWFLWINLIFCISKYFHVILVNTFDKVIYQYYFHFCIIFTTVHPLHLIYIYIYIYIYI